jgi:hypothetical protein
MSDPIIILPSPKMNQKMFSSDNPELKHVKTLIPPYPIGRNVPERFKYVRPAMGISIVELGDASVSYCFENWRWNRNHAQPEIDAFEQEVYSRALRGRDCVYCLVRIDGKILTRILEHIIPWARGGLTHPTNLVCACSKCNWYKLDLLLPDWAGKQPEAKRSQILRIWSLLDLECEDRLKKYPDLFYPESDTLRRTRWPNRNTHDRVPVE